MDAQVPGGGAPITSPVTQVAGSSRKQLNRLHRDHASPRPVLLPGGDGVFEDTMARSRMLNPDFFRDEELAELDYVHRLLFAGLWGLADREGRLENRPKRIKADLFPYDPDVDVVDGLLRLNGHFITLYEVEGRNYIHINNFLKHQKPHPREAPSVIPECQGAPKVCLRQTQGNPRSPESESVSESETVTQSRNIPPSRFTQEQVEAIYEAYPRKKEPRTAKLAIERALVRIKRDGQHEDPAAWLYDRTLRYAASPAGNKDKYTPYPATWFNAEGFNEDPEDWQDAAPVAPAAPPELPSERRVKDDSGRWVTMLTLAKAYQATGRPLTPEMKKVLGL